MRYMNAAISMLFLCAYFSGCTTKKPAIREEIPHFQKPANATQRVEGQKFPYCLWYNPNVWMIWDTPFDSGEEVAEWNLVLLPPEERISIGKHTVIQAGASTYPYEQKNLSYKEFKSLIQNSLVDKNNLESFVELSSDERIVNNIKILAWNFMFKDAGTNAITAYIYFYSDNEGSVAVTAYTASDQWEKNKEVMEQLLNGFCLLKSSN